MLSNPLDEVNPLTTKSISQSLQGFLKICLDLVSNKEVQYKYGDLCLEYSTSQRCSMGEGGRKRIALSRFLFVFYGHLCSLEIGVDIGFKYK